MKLKHFIISGTVIIVLLSFLAFTQRTHGTYEYMTLVQSGNFIQKSIADGEFENIKLEKGQFNSPNYNDYRGVLKLVNEYNANGWEVVSSNSGIASSGSGAIILEKNSVYFLLKKAK